MRPVLRIAASLCALVCLGVLSLSGGCGTVDLGDNIVPPDLQVDEDFFYCEIQPNVLQAKSCAGGAAGEAGSCHTARSALRLIDTSDPPPTCEDGMVVGGDLSADYIANYEAVRFTVQSDPLSSPFYRRPTGLDSHPRVIFPPDPVGDPCARMIVDWIDRGAL
jgi:hypothetical protein